MKPKTPARKIIDRVGGLTRTAEFLSTPDRPVPVTTVQSWGERGKIPQEHWVPLIEAGKTVGEDIKLADFLGITESLSAPAEDAAA